MSVEIIMPKAGVAMEEGVIVSWLKQEGESVKIGEPIIEITTDKVNMEIEAEANGVMAVHIHKEEETLPVFTVIGVIAEKGEEINDIKAKYLASSNSQVAEVVEEIKETTIEVCDNKTENKKSDYDYDVVVLGGGPGGYIAAIKAAMLGGKVAVVEEDTLGGTCLNRGCIPTKTYIKNVELLDEIEHFAKRGIKVKVEENQDIKKAIKYKNRVVKKLTAGVGGLLKSHNIDVFNTKGSIEKAHEVILADGKKLSTDNIIIATGSKVKLLHLKGIESKLLLTSTEMLDLESVPEELVIIGGGVIACEFAEIFNSRGSKVTIVEMEDRLIPRMDKELSMSLQDSLKKKGVKILTNKKVEEFKEDNNKLIVKLGDNEELISDIGLFAIGREANLNGLDKLNIELEKGSIAVNSKMETNIKSIYAVGDVTGLNMLAHAAFKMGEVAASNALGHEEGLDLSSIPSCLYTVPEVASVGMTEEEASLSRSIKIGKFNFAGNGRALASGNTDGYVKVIADAKYGEILGVHMYGNGVSELINHAASFKALEIPADEASKIIFGHPCTSEALMEALADVDGNCMHLPKK